MCKANDEKRLLQAAECLSTRLKSAIVRHGQALAHDTQELRLRLNKPFSAVCADEVFYFIRAGGLSINAEDDNIIVTQQDIDETLKRLCSYSVYARQNELNRGFVTLAGGHRAGVCGTAVIERGEVVNVRQVSSINIRVSGERKGCADPLVSIGAQGLLIAGAPCSGKTTMLRDLARQISLKENIRVSVIDERGELGGKSGGVICSDLGMCDLFDGYPKAVGIEQAIRSMSPDVVVCDEIGSEEDVRALALCACSGVRVIATVHASCADELRRKPALAGALGTGVFEHVAFLAGRRAAGQVTGIMKGGDVLAA